MTRTGGVSLALCRLLGLVSGHAAASTAHLLLAVLRLLDLLARALRLLRQAVADELVLHLELLGRVKVVVDAAEASGLAATKLGLHALEKDEGSVGDTVHLGEVLLKFSLRHVRPARVDHIH